MEYNHSTTSPLWLLEEAEQDFCYGAKASTSQLHSAYLTPPSSSASPREFLGEEWIKNSDTLDNYLSLDTFNDVILTDKSTFNAVDLFADIQDVAPQTPVAMSMATQVPSSSSKNKIVIKLKKVKHQKTSSNLKKKNKFCHNDQKNLKFKLVETSPPDYFLTPRESLDEINQLVLQNRIDSPSSHSRLHNQEATTFDQNQLQVEDNLFNNSWFSTEQKMDDLLLFQDEFLDSVASPVNNFEVCDQSVDQSITLREALSSGDDNLIDNLLSPNSSSRKLYKVEDYSNSIEDRESLDFLETIEFINDPIESEFSPENSSFDRMDSDVTLDIPSTIDQYETFDLPSPLDYDVNYSPSSSDFSDFSLQSPEPRSTKSKTKDRKTKSVRPKITSEMRYLKKKTQNKEAAIRYRNKKKHQNDDLSQQIDVATEEQLKLRAKFQNLKQEVSFMKKLLRETFLPK